MALSRIGGPIHIVGTGCVGMQVGRVIDELGHERFDDDAELHLWDGDIVEPQNLRTQLFDMEHLGFPKVEAAVPILQRWSKLPVIPHYGYVSDRVPLSGIVFVCVHTMAARRTIYENSLKGNEEALMIECRVGEDTSTIHVLDPSVTRYQQWWEHFWYPDPPGADVSCGTVTSLGPITSLTAQIAVWQAVRFAEIVAGAEDRLVNQIRVEMRPPKIESYVW